jgi:hypothetical protein
MINPKDYKYRDAYAEDDIVYAIVVKPPHWMNRPDDICRRLPVGAITWFGKSYVQYDKQGIPFLPEESSVCPESNLYGMNFDPTCFELLHTSKQKVKR